MRASVGLSLLAGMILCSAEKGFFMIIIAKTLNYLQKTKTCILKGIHMLQLQWNVYAEQIHSYVKVYVGELCAAITIPN